MSRPIKFRVWDKENKRFGYIHLSENKIALPSTDWINKECGFIDDDTGNLQTIIFNNIEGFQQFTGLSDKNGKEIYEGDILFINEGYEKAIVKFGKYYSGNNYHMGFYLKKYYDFGSDKNCINITLNYIEMHSSEIKGNIFENPELLNQR